MNSFLPVIIENTLLKLILQSSFISNSMSVKRIALMFFKALPEALSDPWSHTHCRPSLWGSTGLSAFQLSSDPEGNRFYQPLGREKSNEHRN